MAQNLVFWYNSERMETIIQVENCYSWLYTNNNEVRTKLWRAMRHRERNYFHSRLYKQKLWDGYTEFFKKESGRFLTGLLAEVTAALDHWKVPYKILDQRKHFKFRFNEIDENFLNQWLPPGADPCTLYDYQVDLTNTIIKHKRGVVCAPTASGKTLIMISILKALPQNCPTVILANRKSLVEQNYQEMMEWGFENVGRLYDRYNDPNIFTCATVQSLHKMGTAIGKVRAMVVDEIHENMSKKPKQFFNKMKACSVRVAVSATPFKFGGTDRTQKFSVKGYFGPIMRSTSMGGVLTTNKMQKRGTLSSSKCIFYPIREPMIPYDIYLDAVTNGIAENWKFHEIVKRLVDGLKGRTLILVDRIAHGDALNSMIEGSLWVRGKDNLETRKKVINQLKKSKEKVVAIATQQIFNAGINVMTHNVINAAGGQADHQIVQRIGRGLRTADDKEQLNYYDFVFEINDYLFDHSRKRIRILTEEGHDVEVKDEIDF
jgi:superfamily II DNA or RNA helicase